MTWVPWTHRRLAAATGYGAGVAQPRVVRTTCSATPARTWSPAGSATVAPVLRADGHAASPAQLIDASRLAEALATMRGRPLAGLAEVTDAAGRRARRARRRCARHDELVVGTRSARCPPTRRMVPLARDLAGRASGAAPARSRRARTLELDLRTPNGLRRSHLLHRLALLGVPGATLARGRGAQRHVPRDLASCAGSPSCRCGSSSAAGHGTTVEPRPPRRRCSSSGRPARAGWPTLTPAVERRLLADLPDALRPVMRALGRAGRGAPEVAS